MDDTRYCICCGEDVPYNTVVRNERRELTCQFCGFTLDVTNLWEDQGEGERGVAMVAEDSDLTRNLLRDIIANKALSGEVVAVSNGLELTTEFSRYLKEGKRIEFVIIDLNMPLMDGLTAARTIRAIEKGAGMGNNVPLIFFSSRKADEDLKNQMGILAPAHYMNKGSDPDPESLAHRIEGLVNFIQTTYS